MVGAVVPAAGRGSRFGSTENKVFASAGGRLLLEWTLESLASHGRIGALVVAAGAADRGRVEEVSSRFHKVVAVVEGGATRAESVLRGLEALPVECEVVLVHDAARPALSAALIDRVIAGVEAHGGAVPGLPISDTVKRVAENGMVLGTVPREGLFTVQTPQGARREDLLAAYRALGEAAFECTDEAALLERAGCPVTVVPGEERNIKVTHPADLERIEAVLLPALAEVRTGFGYDVHATDAERPLWLGGIRFEGAIGLRGHSDADVVLHALTDAVLGAAGLGDIGLLFPDTDERNRGRASRDFLEYAVKRAGEAGWQVANVDISLVAEEPKIGPYREPMADAIAEVLGVCRDQVNIKATTSERLGFVGRKEGMACWAVATLQRRRSRPEER